MKKAEKDGNQKLATQLKARMAKVRERIRQLQGGPAKEAVTVEQKADSDMLPEVVRETYLRTLSREPNEDELSRSVAYVESTPDQLAGVRDLLWALVNTKEFIINH